MRLREVSGNEVRRPPDFSSPMVKPLKGRKQRTLDLRKTSFGAPERIVSLEKEVEQKTEHIDYLEDQLLQARNDTLSPQSGRIMKEKLKAMGLESKKLESMIEGLERAMEERLKDAMEHKTALEVELRRKIKSLEDDVNDKNCAIRDLEYHNDRLNQAGIDSLKANIDKLQKENKALEESNRRLTKKTDVLMDLISQSPTRSHHGFEIPSPVRESSRTARRPMSVMKPSRPIPISPQSKPFSRPVSIQSSPAPSLTGHFSSFSAFEQEHAHPCNRAGNADPQKHSIDPHSLDSGLGESCSVRSGPDMLSKRSSIVSSTSMSPSAWGLPLSSSPVAEKPEPQQRKRSTRRFASGSRQLRQLVLPTIAAVSSQLQSAPVALDNSSLPYRDFSQQSIDPTTSFISQAFDTPTQPRRRSKRWTTEDALRALEGQSDTGESPIAAEEPNDCYGDPDDPASQTDEANLISSQLILSDHLFSPTVSDAIILEEDLLPLDQSIESDGYSFSSLNVHGETSLTESELERAMDDQGDETVLPIQDYEFQHDEPLAEAENVDAGSIDDQDDQYANIRASHQPFWTSVVHYVDEIQLTHFLHTPTWSTQRVHKDMESIDRSQNSSSQKRRRSDTPSELSINSTESLLSAESVPLLLDMHRHAGKLVTPPCTQTAGRPSTPQRELQEPAQSSHVKTFSPPLLIQRKAPASIPLTALQNRTVFGTIHRYTTYLREFKRDPTALARRVLANAWRSNWKRLGKLSWWVLGLFLGPGVRKAAEARMWTEERGWEEYDAQNIADRTHEDINGPGPALEGETLPPRSPTRVRFDDREHCEYRTRGTKKPAKSALKSSKQPQPKHGCGKSLYLWGKFSVAVMLAIGGAVVKGPAEMLKDCESQQEPLPRIQRFKPSFYHDPADDNDFEERELNRDNSQLDSDDGDQFIEDVRDVKQTVSSKYRNGTPPNHQHHADETSPLLSHSQHHHLCQPSKTYTFGSPSKGEYDCYQDNTSGQPVRAWSPDRYYQAAEQSNHSTYDASVSTKQQVRKNPADHFGSFEWMQKLTTDNLQDNDDSLEGNIISPTPAGKKSDIFGDKGESDMGDGGMRVCSAGLMM